jgi:Na+-driven multidrug efflux pump
VLGFTVGWGALGVWLSFPLSFVAKLLMSVVAYKRGSWARVGVKAG